MVLAALTSCTAAPRLFKLMEPNNNNREHGLCQQDASGLPLGMSFCLFLQGSDV